MDLGTTITQQIIVMNRWNNEVPYWHKLATSNAFDDTKLFWHATAPKRSNYESAWQNKHLLKPITAGKARKNSLNIKNNNNE